MEGLQHEVGEVLGLPGRRSDLDWAILLSEGLPTAAFERLCAAIAPEDKTFPYKLVPRSTLVRRRQESRLTPEESERVQRVAEIWTFAVEVFGDEAKARRFLMRGHPMLRGESSISLVVANSKGAQVVEGILGRLKYGSAA